MRIAALLNPYAGNAGRIRGAAEAISSFAAGHELLCAGSFGGGLSGCRALAIDETLPYVARLHAAVDALAGESPALYIVAGGDGMAAYVAGRLLRTGHTAPRLLGLALGTANVGPIIAMDAAALARFDPDRLCDRTVGAIELFDGETSVAFAFNDAVLGNTLLATLDGTACTVSARRLAESGALERAEPMADIGPVTVEKNGVRCESALPRVAQIIVSPVERENLFGRAVTGVLCFTAGGAERAALLLSERPLVTMAYDARGYTRLAASEQLLFSEGDRLRVLGADSGALLIADGNPYLRKADAVSFRYRPGLIRAVQAG